MDRIKKLCAYLSKCNVFADIGCDHGYCTRYMLENGLCDRAIISDISPKSLKKAEELLNAYIQKGKCLPVCCDGLEGIDRSADLVLIAGMGGEEIISILDKSYIPAGFVLQPMHNVKKLRGFLLSHGASIDTDEPFECGGKYYFVLCGRADCGCEYTSAQLEYGKGDINGALGGYIRSEISKKRGYLKNNISEKSRSEILNRIEFAEGVLKGEIV